MEMTAATREAKNDVRATAVADDRPMGHGVRPRTTQSADEQLWQRAYDDAVRQGAGPDVARVFANQTVAYERAERDGVELPGAGDIQAYR